MCGIVNTAINQVRNISEGYQQDPERAVLGINTTYEGDVWQGVTGKDYGHPLVGDLATEGSGQTNYDRQTAAQRGINPGMTPYADMAARMAAFYFGGAALGGAVGAGAEAGTGAEGGVGFDPGGEGMYSAPTQSGSMPSALAETPDALKAQGLTESSPGVWESSGSSAGLVSDGTPQSQFTAQASDSNFVDPNFSMPSALPESSNSLTSQGLTQTSPGVWDNTGSSGGTWYEEMLKRARAHPMSTGVGLFQSGQGLYGLYAAQQQSKLAARAAASQDPFGPQRAQYQQQLAQLMSNPSGITSMPGYEAGMQAVTRKMAAQGYLGSGNMMASLQQYGGQFYNDAVARLTALSGANIGPSGGSLLLQGEQNKLAMQGQSINNIGYGLSRLFQ